MIKDTTQELYKKATETFENYILNRDSFQSRYVCAVTNKTYPREQVKVGYLFNPLIAPNLAFKDINAHVEVRGLEENEERFNSVKASILFEHGKKALKSLVDAKKTKNWHVKKRIVELQEIIEKLS